MKIYTRTGDKGMTSLFTGERVYKDNPFIQAIGAVDEGNCMIGSSIAFIPKEPSFDALKRQLEIIQHALFDAGAALATPRTTGTQEKIKKTRFGHEAVEQLEKWMDEMDEQLPPLKYFILPGGHPAGAHLHIARSTIRRAERLVIPLYEQHDVDEDVLVYLNRLSDYLFMASRFANHLLKIPETRWQAHLTPE